MTTYRPMGIDAVVTAMEHRQNDFARSKPKLGRYLDTIEYLRGSEPVQDAAKKLIHAVTGKYALDHVEDELKLNTIIGLEMAQLSHDPIGVMEKLTENTAWTTTPPDLMFERYQRFASQVQRLYPHQSNLELAEIDQWLRNLQNPNSLENQRSEPGTSRVGYVPQHGFNTRMASRLLR